MEKKKQISLLLSSIFIISVCSVFTATASPLPHVTHNGPWIGEEDTPIYFSATVYDMEGDSYYDWVWTFYPWSGGAQYFTIEKRIYGSAGTTHSFYRTFNEESEYRVAVIVTGSSGRSAGSGLPVNYPNLIIQDTNEPLTVDANGPYYGDPGEYISFCADATGGEPPYTFHWEFSDGTDDDGQCVYKVFTQTGEYMATVSVTDDDGTTVSDNAYVYIGNYVDLTIQCITPYFHKRGCSEVEFDVTIQADSSGSGCVDYQYEIYIGTIGEEPDEGNFDGTICAGNTLFDDPEWNNPPNGIYYAVATVYWTDSDGSHQDESQPCWFVVGTPFEPIPV